MPLEHIVNNADKQALKWYLYNRFQDKYVLRFSRIENGVDVLYYKHKLDTPANLRIGSTNRGLDYLTYIHNPVRVANGYDYEYKKVSETNYSSATNTTGTNAKITGLDSGTRYDIRVKAERDDLVYDSDWASIREWTKLDYPRNLRVTARTATSVTLAWDSVTGATSYDIDGPTDKFGITGTATTYTPLGTFVKYGFRVRAKNSNNNDEVSVWSPWLYAWTLAEALNDNMWYTADEELYEITAALPTDNSLVTSVNRTSGTTGSNSHGVHTRSNGNDGTWSALSPMSMTALNNEAYFITYRQLGVVNNRIIYTTGGNGIYVLGDYTTGHSRLIGSIPDVVDTTYDVEIHMAALTTYNSKLWCIGSVVRYNKSPKTFHSVEHNWYEVTNLDPFTIVKRSSTTWSADATLDGTKVYGEEANYSINRSWTPTLRDYNMSTGAATSYTGTNGAGTRGRGITVHDDKLYIRTYGSNSGYYHSILEVNNVQANWTGARRARMNIPSVNNRGTIISKNA